MGYLAYQLVSRISSIKSIASFGVFTSKSLSGPVKEERASYEEKAKVAKAAKSNADAFKCGVLGRKGVTYDNDQKS